MASPDPSGVDWEGLPRSLQGLVAAVVAIVTYILYQVGYKRTPPEPKAQSTEVQVVSGAFADRQMLRDMAMQMERGNDLLERLCDLLERQINARDEEAREARMIDRMMDELQKLEERKRRD